MPLSPAGLPAAADGLRLPRAPAGGLPAEPELGGVAVLGSESCAQLAMEPEHQNAGISRVWLREGKEMGTGSLLPQLLRLLPLNALCRI